MSAKSSPHSARKPAPHAADSPSTSRKSLGVGDMARTPRGSGQASAEPSPRGSRKELTVAAAEDMPMFVGTVKPSSRPGSGRASPRVDLKSAALMANPPGAMKNPDMLKSWEVKALLPVEWRLKDTPKGKFQGGFLRFLHELMSGYDDVIPGSLPVFEVTMADVKEKAHMVAEEGHPFVVRVPTLDDGLVDLSFDTAEEATALLARADPESFPHGLKGDLRIDKDATVWRVSVLHQEVDGHTEYDITCVSPHKAYGKAMRLHGRGRYSAIKEQHAKSIAIHPESASIPFPPGAVFGTKDPKFIQDRAFALRQYFFEAMQHTGLMLFWKNGPLFKDLSDE